VKLLLAPFRGIAQAASEFFQELSPFEENVNLAYELEQGFQAIMKGAEFATAVVTGFFKSIAGLANDAIGAVLGFANSIKNGVVSVFTGLGEIIHQKLTSLYNALPAPLKALINMAAGAASAVGGAISGAVGQVSGGINALAQAGGFGQQGTVSATSPAANNIQKTNNVLGGQDVKKAKAQKEVVKMSQEEFNLRQAIRDAKLTEGEIDDVNAKFALQKFEIGNRFNDDILGGRNALLDAELEKNQALQRIEEKRQEDADRAAKKAADEAQKQLEADPLFQMQKRMEELLDVQNQVAAGATVIGNSFAGAFKSVITGSKSAEDALKDMLAATAEHFLDMAMQIIAQQITMILYGTIMKALGISMPGVGGGGGFGSGASAPLTSGLDFSSAFAEGGYVSGPTNALIGEGGEPEYVIPESKMRESMSRYSRGARGGSVIPETGASGASSEDGGTAVAAPIDVRYTVERINNVDYVTADQFQAGMRQAATQGAKQGEQQTLKRLQMSSGTRKRLGM